MTTALKQKHDGSLPLAMNVPGDLCSHFNKKCTLEGKSNEAIAIQCDVCFEWVHATIHSVVTLVEFLIDAIKKVQHCTDHYINDDYQSESSI